MILAAFALGDDIVGCLRAAQTRKSQSKLLRESSTKLDRYSIVRMSTEQGRGDSGICDVGDRMRPRPYRSRRSLPVIVEAMIIADAFGR